jgi:hypothetical protein
MEDFCSFVESLGSLHDVKVTSFTWMPSRAEIRVSVGDLYANFRGLPEYKGPLPAAFLFSGVSQLHTAIDPAEPGMRIFGWSVRVIPGGYSSEILFSPSGKINVWCSAIVQVPTD